jgi:hypothetical protein
MAESNEGTQGDLLDQNGGAAGAGAGDKASDASKAGDAGKAAAADQAPKDGEQGKADAAKDQGKADAKADAPQEPAPVDYGAAIKAAKMPEGFTLDDARATQAAEFFKNNNVPADKVQDYIDFYASNLKANAEANGKAFAEQVNGWRAESEKSFTAEERGAAKEALLKVFSKEDAEVMEAFGLTNRSGIIKSLLKMSKAIKDDTFVPGNAGGSGVRDARTQFPNSNMNP